MASEYVIAETVSGEKQYVTRKQWWFRKAMRKRRSQIHGVRLKEKQ